MSSESPALQQVTELVRQLFIRDRQMNEEMTLEEQFELLNETLPETPITPVEPQETIPTNSSTYSIDLTTSRFSSALWYDSVQSKSVLIAGLGGIGSYVAFLIGRMKPATLALYDNDRVEEVNMSGQLYGYDHIGTFKTSATNNILSSFAGYFSSITYTERFTVDSTPLDIMICGFDNMKARKDFFAAWQKHVESKPEEDRKMCLFIDGRLNAEEFQVFSITGDDVYHQELYKDKWLFSDSEADATVCSYKQTSFCANMIASVMVNIFVNFCAQELDPVIPRETPFLVEYTASSLYFKVES